MRFSIRIYATEIHDIDLKLKNGNKNQPISSVSLYANQMCFNIEYIRMTRFISSSTITIRCCVCISLYFICMLNYVAY